MRTCCSSFVHWCAYPHYYTPCLLSSYLRCVVSQPIVRLSEIIKDDATAITSACREHNGRTGVGLGCDPGTVEGVHDEEGGDNQHHTIGNLSNTITIHSLHTKLEKQRQRFNLFTPHPGSQIISSLAAKG